MKNLIFLFTLLISTAAIAQNATQVVVVGAGGNAAKVDNSGNLQTTATFTPSGTQDVNIAKTNGGTVAVGHGTAATALRVELPTDGTGVVGLNAGTAVVGKVGIDQTTDVTTNGVEIAPTAAAAAGLALVSSTAAESSHVLKSGAGNLYYVTTTIGATSGYLMLFNATSAPVDGAVTPAYCLPIASNGTFGAAAVGNNSGPPMFFSTGITAVFSSTGCFTKTASATAAFFGGVK